MAAWDQPPLFDAVSVGERVLSELETVEPGALLSQLTGVALGNWMAAMGRTQAALLDVADCRRDIAATHPLLRAALSMDGIAQLAAVERGCARATSLLGCFPLAVSLVDRLLLLRSTPVADGEERQAVLAFFAAGSERAAAAGGGAARGRAKGPPSPAVLPRADRRELTVMRPSQRCSAVGDRLQLQIIEDRDWTPSAFAPAARGSGAATAAGLPSSSSSASPVPSLPPRRFLPLTRRAIRRLRRGPSGGGAAADEAEDDDEEEPAVRLSTAFETHWPPC